MTPTEKLLSIEEIRSVKARYCRFLDTKNWVGLAGLFTVDAVLDVKEDTGQEPFIGRDLLIEQIRRAVIHAKSAHQVHTPEIELLGAHEANIIWAMQDRVVWDEGHSPLPGVKSITGFGHYHERYVRQEGRWLIASLKLTRLYVEQHSE
jgi:SnoaL-like domain